MERKSQEIVDGVISEINDRPGSREERPKSKGITKGLIDKLAEEQETFNINNTSTKSTDDAQYLMREKIQHSLMNHYAPSEHDFQYPILEEPTQDEVEPGMAF